MRYIGLDSYLKPEIDNTHSFVCVVSKCRVLGAHGIGDMSHSGGNVAGWTDPLPRVRRVRPSL